MERAKPVTSPPMTSQEDQSGAKPTHSGGGHSQRNNTITNQTKVQLESAEQNLPPPLLYIPASPSPTIYETPTLPILSTTIPLTLSLITAT